MLTEVQGIKNLTGRKEFTRAKLKVSKGITETLQGRYYVYQVSVGISDYCQQKSRCALERKLENKLLIRYFTFVLAILNYLPLGRSELTGSRKYHVISDLIKKQPQSGQSSKEVIS